MKEERGGEREREKQTERVSNENILFWEMVHGDITVNAENERRERKREKREKYPWIDMTAYTPVLPIHLLLHLW